LNSKIKVYFCITKSSKIDFSRTNR